MIENRPKMKKYSLLLFLALLICGGGYAQQDAQYTQFMFNKLAYNPGYAGSAGLPCVSALYRNQWVGLEGAPKTQLVSFHSPFLSDRTAGGLTVIRDDIGPTESWYFALAYAYRIPTKNGTLGLGLQGILRNYRVKWNELEGAHINDDLIETADGSRLLPNVGAGVYFESRKFYIGASVPHIVENDISLVDESVGGSLVTARERVHAYLMTGYIFDLNKQVKFKPSVLLKYVANAPFDMDVNGSFLFMEKVSIGATYRLGGSTRQGIGESIDLVALYYFSNYFKLGAAYDITLSELRQETNGSFEILLQHCFRKKNERFTNPRFFL